MSKLKPCPFCGSKAELKDLIYRANCGYAVCCTNIDCRVSTIYTLYSWHSKEDAIKAWNTREGAEK